MSNRKLDLMQQRDYERSEAACCECGFYRSGAHHPKIRCPKSGRCGDCGNQWPCGDHAPKPPKDGCEVCRGDKGGVRGNENVIAGIVVCDYCHADGSYRVEIFRRAACPVHGVNPCGFIDDFSRPITSGVPHKVEVACAHKINTVLKEQYHRVSKVSAQ